MDIAENEWMYRQEAGTHSNSAICNLVCWKILKVCHWENILNCFGHVRITAWGQEVTKTTTVAAPADKDDNNSSELTVCLYGCTELILAFLHHIIWSRCVYQHRWWWCYTRNTEEDIAMEVKRKEIIEQEEEKEEDHWKRNWSGSSYF
jgi:hypothetical protein